MIRECARGCKKAESGGRFNQNIPASFEKNLGDENDTGPYGLEISVIFSRAAEMYINMLKYRRLGAEDRVSEEYRKLKEYLGRTEEEWQEGLTSTGL